MKKIKKISALALAAALSVSLALPVSAEFIKDDEGYKYYVKEDGTYATGLYYTPINEGQYDECYRMCSYGEDGKYKDYYTGFTKTKKGRRYYMRGEMLTGWQNIDGNYYHFSERGFADTGKCRVAREIYIFDENGVWTGTDKYTYPEDFAVSFVEGYGRDNRLYTAKNKVQKLVDYNKYVSAEHVFSKDDLQVLWSMICEYNLTSVDTSIRYADEYAENVLMKKYPDDKELTVWGVTPENCFEISLRANGKTYTIKGAEELRQAVGADKTAHNIIACWDYLHRLLINTEEYKSLPDSTVGYD